MLKRKTSSVGKCPTLMITGLGNIGGHVLDIITKIPDNHIKIIVTGRDEDTLCRKKNMALLTASQFGLYPHIEYEVLDLIHVDQTAEVIKKYKPDVIFNSASIQSWRKVTELPKNVYKDIDKACFGPWLPMHLPLVYNLAKAIKASGHSPFFINSAYPDAVNPILHKVGLAPHVGIGNIANAIPGIRHSISSHIQSPIKDIEVRFVAHHYISHHVSRHGYPNPNLFYIRTYLNGKDITSELDLEAIFNDIPTKFRRMVGLEGQPMTATSAIRVIMAALHNTNDRMHAPGPNGYPGGYPVRVNATEVTIDLPTDLSLEQARAFNEKSQELEGITQIDAEGTAYFNPQNIQVMKKMLGYECEKMKIADCFHIAAELKAKYSAFANQYG